jgi:peptide/nickel transport system substrate-binding protein
MIPHGLRYPAAGLFAAFLLLLVMACGAPAATEPAPDTPTPDPMATATPAPEPVPTEEPGEVVPEGTLNFAWVPMGPFTAHPRFADSSRGHYMPITAYEGLGWMDAEGVLQPRLGDWSVSEDGTVWTFNLREGIPLHKGYGEMTAEDLRFSLTSASEPDSVHSRAGQVREWFRAEEGWVETVDDYTLQVHTGVPIYGVETQLGGGMSSMHAWIVSKAQSDELGEEEATRMAAGTGPWEIVEHRTGEFWRFDAVQDHWRKTPEFAQMVWWDIPEESTRVANFRARMLDSMNMDLDSIPAVEGVDGVKFMRMPDAGGLNLLLYGQWYIGLGTEDQRTGYDPNLPWVSADPDPESEEWARARMVREALSLAIDREGIVQQILRGEGRPGETPFPWIGREERLGQVGYDYDPDRAIELLAEAGYADGFEIQLNAGMRGLPGETLACEAIGAMWGDIGVRANITRIAHATIRPAFVNRDYQGAYCFSRALDAEATDGFIGNYRTAALFNVGIEHPWVDERVNTAMRTVVDVEERMAIEEEIGRFMYENFIHSVIYTPNTVFPISNKIDEWELSMIMQRAYLNNFEYVPHRR